MTYSSNYKEDRYESIGPILSKLQTLDPGGRLSIRGLAPDEQSRVRSLLYDWFHHLGAKARFKIRSEPGSLTVIDQRFRSELTMTVETPLSSREEDELMGELIENYETAEAVISCWLEEGKITPERAKSLRARLEEVMS